MPKVASINLLQWIFIPAIVIGYLIKIDDGVPYPMFTELTTRVKQKAHGNSGSGQPSPIAIPGAITHLCPRDRLAFYVLTCQSLTEATKYKTL